MAIEEINAPKGQKPAVSAKKARLVKIPKTEMSSIIITSDYTRIAYKLFKKYADKHGKANHALERDLAKAHMKTLAEWYTAEKLMSTIIAAAASIAVAAVLTMVFKDAGMYRFLFWIIPPGVAAGVYLFYSVSPSMAASSRGKDIDLKLPYAMSFVSAMASANVNLDVIFRELAEEKIYGEIANEAAYIARDIFVFKKDILTALHIAIERCPSVSMQEFYQGVIVTSTAGGKLKPYFVMKADEAIRKNAIEQKGFLETLGMLAETFVTVVVAFPLFLVVLMSVMSIIGGSTGSSLQLLYLVTFLMLPLSQFGFIFAITTISEGRA